jgi:prolyl-tRNA synthetase
MIGGLIMTHGDDDGLRVPPAVAPQQIVILPMLRDTPEDDALLAYCEDLRAQLAAHSALGEKVRVLLDKRPGKATQKRWAWVKKGVPLILEIGGRDAAGGQVSMLRRDRLWTETAKANFVALAKDDFVARAVAEIEDIQTSLFAEAKAKRDANIASAASFDEVAAFFAPEKRYPGWVEVEWARPTGDELEAVVQKLKGLKLTMRNTPLGGAPATGTCIFTGRPAVERIYVARSY